MTPAENAAGVCGSEKIQAYYSACPNNSCTPSLFLEEDIKINVSSNNCQSVNYLGITGANEMLERFLGGTNVGDAGLETG